MGLFTALAAAAEHQIVNTVFSWWALLQCERLRDTWSLFNHAKNVGYSFSPCCCEVLLMECEQRKLYGHEIALFDVLEYAVSSDNASMDLRAPNERVAALRLSKTNDVDL